MGVSDFLVTVDLPKDLTQDLPSIEDVQRELERQLGDAKEEK